MKKNLIAAFAIMILTVYLTAQQLSPQTQAALQLVREQKWEEAAAALDEVVKSEPDNGRAWFYLGSTRHRLGQYEKAVEAYQKNIPISRNPAAMYNLACAYARLKDPEKAFEWLEKSITSGNGIGLNPAADEDLINIKNDPRFPKLLDLLDRKSKPCKYLPEARQFDFWVGDWDVFNPANQKVGTNTVQSFSEGCGILENWTSTIGNDGKSLNYYDKVTAKWYQSWIGSGGGAIRYEGNFKEGAMRFENTITGLDGRKIINKLTFFKIDDNTVRQLAESSNDEGKSWSIGYDFKYVRKK